MTDGVENLDVLGQWALISGIKGGSRWMDGECWDEILVKNVRSKVHNILFKQRYPEVPQPTSAT